MSEPTLDLRAVEALLNACAAHGELTAIVPCGNLRALYDLAVRAVAAGAGDPDWKFQHITAHDLGAGDRPPAPSAHTVIDFALDEIIRLGQAARPFVDEVAIAKHRGAIHDAVRAVRPTPRAAPSDAAIAAARAVAKDAEWERWDPSYKVRQMLRAAYAVDFGASPAAAPPQETGR